VLTYHPHDFYLPLLQKAGVEYTCLESKSKLQRILEVRQALRRGDQDVVLAFLEGPCFYAELAALPSRKWGLVVSERLAVPGSHKARLPWRRWLHHVADYIVTNSHTNRLMIERAAPRLVNRVVTIYNALDLEAFCPRPEQERSGSEGLKLVVAARHGRQKNAPGLVEALSLLRTRAPDVKVSVDWYGYDPFAFLPASEPTPFRELQELIRKRGLESQFRLHPDVREIADIYHTADAVVLPSFFEGLPNTVCEAMGCGRPVLVSNVCDAGNLVHDGLSGFVFDPRSPESMALAILKLASLSAPKREALGKEGRRMAEEMLHPRTVLSKYTELLAVAAARKRTSLGHWVPTVPVTAYEAINGCASER
jgi:glycosyltransferase involved in cell wall biosynthesis